MLKYCYISCLVFFLGCGGPFDLNENGGGGVDNLNGNANVNGSSDNTDQLRVSLGDDREVFVGETVSLQASVEGGEKPYWFLWKYFLPIEGDSDAQEAAFIALQPDFVEGLSGLEIVFEENTPQLKIEVEVIDNAGEHTSGTVVLTVVPQEDFGQNQDDQLDSLENENGNANEDDALDNENENAAQEPGQGIDFCPNDANKSVPGMCGCGVSDVDSDSDGAPDCLDDCPSDINKTAAGACGCGISDADSDGDGTVDCNDSCPSDPNKTAPGDCGCGMADVDADVDGLTDLNTNFSTSFNMSMFEGSLRLTPSVCGGVQPYSYSWTDAAPPVDYLEDPGFPGSGQPAITVAEVEFTPPSAGAYPYTLTITDNDSPPSVLVRNFTITVDGNSPLSADAGADQVVSVGDTLNLAGSAGGGSGNYSYAWTPGGPNTATYSNVPTGAAGDTVYTLTVTDTDTNATASDTVRVVVLSGGGGACVQSDTDLGVGSARFVAYDAGYGSYGMGIVASNNTLYFIDLQDGSQIATLALPADVKGLVVDSTRRRAFVTTRLSGSATKSVAVIDLDTRTLDANIGLTSNVAAASGMAVIPSSGKVVVAVTGTSHGLMLVNPDTGLLEAALQNIHHTGSFESPVDVSVVEQGGLSVAAVANGSGSFVTLVPLSSINFTADDPTGGGQATLPQVAINGGGRAIVADPTNSRVIVGWNNGGGAGRVQIVNLTSNSAGSAESNINLSGTITDQGMDIDVSRSEVYAATGNGGAVAVNLSYGIVSNVLQAASTTAMSVAAEPGQNTVAIVGVGSNLSERCP